MGDGAFIGTGSVVTHDVPADALVVARARAVEKPGWAKTFRDAHAPGATNPAAPGGATQTSKG